MNSQEDTNRFIQLGIESFEFLGATNPKPLVEELARSQQHCKEPNENNEVRSYHDIVHPLFMNDELTTFYNLGILNITEEDFHVIRAAILGHDYRIRPQYDENGKQISGEEYSARYVETEGAKLGARRMKEVGNLIRVTQRNREPVTLLEKIILDSDIRNLAWSDVEYAMENTKKLALERTGTEPEFRKGSAGFLKMMSQPKLFYHEGIANYKVNGHTVEEYGQKNIPTIISRLQDPNYSLELTTNKE